jgi:hypothetical protein
MLRRVLIVGLLVISAGTICNRAFGTPSPGYPTGPVPTPLPTPPPSPTPSPAPSATPTPTPAPSPTPVPPSYVLVTTLETPRLQYCDGSSLVGAASPYGPYTCLVAMYLASTDPVQFELVRTFEPRYPDTPGHLDNYGPSRYVSSPGVSAQFTATGQLAKILTTLTVYPHPENPYGRETLSVYILDNNRNTQSLLGAVPILVYPKATAKIFNAFVSNPTPSPLPVASPSPYPNPSPYPIPYPAPSPASSLTTFTGDMVRFNVEIYNAYPGGTTWVTVTSPTLSNQEVPNSRVTAPSTDLIPKRNVFIEVGTAKNFSGVLLFPTSAIATPYTIKVMQYRPPYSPITFLETLATASFTISSSFNIDSQVGKLAP